MQAWRSQVKAPPHVAVIVCARSLTSFAPQLGWDGASEESWDALRAQLFSRHAEQPDVSSPSSPARAVVSDSAHKSTNGPRSSRAAQKSQGTLPLLPPKVKSSVLPSEYRVLKNSLHRAEECAAVVLQALESNIADSDHMITLDPRWISQFTESNDDNAGPGPFELAIQKANKLLDFLNQKQREQEACEAMMQQLLDAYNAAEAISDTKDFGQVVRPSNIADATGNWDGLRSELEIQVRRIEACYVQCRVCSHKFAASKKQEARAVCGAIV
jgi:hypothetical protein